LSGAVERITMAPRMPIVGDHPESGLRFVLERPHDASPPWIYRGDVFTPDARVALVVEVAPGGEVRVEVGDGAPAELSELGEKTRLLFRALYKQANDAGAEPRPPPRKVVRWRGDK
jgi:hypothetical protein